LTKEELEKLIEGKPDEIKIKALLLFNNRQKARIKLNEASSTANLRNYQAAERALEEFAVENGWAETDDALASLAAVMQYLNDNGWKSSRSSLYRHHKEGKIVPDDDGKYSKRVVDKYARTFLKQSSTGKKVNEATDELQQKKLRQEIELQAIRIDRERLGYEKDRGLLIPREQMEIELATRAGILVAGLKHWILMNAAGWITAVSGDPKRVGDLINIMVRDVDEHINNYAGNKEYEVIIEAADTT